VAAVRGGQYRKGGSTQGCSDSNYTESDDPVAIISTAVVFNDTIHQEIKLPARSLVCGCRAGLNMNSSYWAFLATWLSRAALLTFGAFALSACQHLNPNEAHPVLSKTFGPNKKDDVGEAIAITSNRRIVIVMVKPEKSNGESGEWGKFCAEPPPDTATELFTSFSAYVDAKHKSRSSLDAGVVSTYNQFAKSLFQRSQGIQYLRDSFYNLCQLYANNALKENEVSAKFNEIIQNAKGLIDTELRTCRDSKVNLDQAPPKAGQ
jgi:hypothetical protein